MRWFAPLVALCLLVGGAARPRVERRDPGAPRVVQATDAIASLTPSRRVGPHAETQRGLGGPHDLRALGIPPFTAPAGLAAPAPRWVAISSSDLRASDLHASLLFLTRTSRGPPALGSLAS